MPSAIITYDLYIRASAEAIWDALTNPDLTQRYWAETRIESDWKVGSTILYVRRGEITDAQEILEIDPPRLLRHTFKPLFGEFRDEAASLVRLEILPGGEVSHLRLRHDQFPPESRVFPACSVGWPRILSSLKSLLETGKALPDVID